MLTIDPKEIPVPRIHGLLLGAVVPRPIAFASTMDKAGRVNLSPFSFFNAFSANPPILVFSPSRRGRDGSTKNTLDNIQETMEAVVNVVSYSMVAQASLASCEYPRGVNEFVKAGLTEAPSVKVKPPRVAESPVAFECKVNQVIALGAGGAAGNLVICEVLLMHINDEVLDEQGRISPYKLDAVARMGQDYYCRAQGENIFAIPRPNEKLGIGFDAIPDEIKASAVLTKNDLGRLGNIESLPGEAAVASFGSTPEVQRAQAGGVRSLHELAQKYIKEGKVEEAWLVLLGGI